MTASYHVFQCPSQSNTNANFTADSSWREPFDMVYSCNSSSIAFLVRCSRRWNWDLAPFVISQEGAPSAIIMVMEPFTASRPPTHAR